MAGLEVGISNLNRLPCKKTNKRENDRTDVTHTRRERIFTGKVNLESGSARII